MTTLILLAAMSQLPVELYVVQHTAESRQIMRCLNTDIPCHDEDQRVMRHYQDELRRIVKVRESVDSFVKIGRHKQQIPMIALDGSPMFTLWLKRCCDEHNARHRTYAETTDNHETAIYAGIIDLGSEAAEAESLPLPWRADYEFTAFRAPMTEK